MSECTCDDPTTEEEIEDHGASPNTDAVARVVYCTDCLGVVEREEV